MLENEIKNENLNQSKIIKKQTCTEVTLIFYFIIKFNNFKVIEKIGFGKYQFFIFIITGLLWMADAMEVMLLSCKYFFTF